ncbi:MAG: nickel-responsive transcriptional regulator NikR [Thermoplasmata archaeon]
MGVERFGVSIDKKLLEKFDVLIKSKGYSSRSEAIRDLIRDAINEEETEEGSGFGTLTLVYDHEAGNVVEKLLEIQHHGHDHIISTTHIHLSAHLCMEIVALRGRIPVMKKISERLRALKGVLLGKLVIVRPAED